MEKEITSHLQEAENAGANGDLEKSQKYVKKVEELRAEIDNAKKACFFIFIKKVIIKKKFTIFIDKFK